MTDWVVSHSDLEKHPKYGKISNEEILYQFGMDVDKGYEADGREQVANEEEGTEGEFGYSHRSPFTGEIHTCPRYFGAARTDGKWKLFTEVFVKVSR